MGAVVDAVMVTEGLPRHKARPMIPDSSLAAVCCAAQLRLTRAKCRPYDAETLYPVGLLMLRKFLGKATFKRVTVDSSRRVPPGQYISRKMPVMTSNDTPKIDLANWRLRIFGEVEAVLKFTWEEFMALAQTGQTSDFHCVTQWSKLDVAWEGVPVRHLLEQAQPRAQAKYATVHCYDGYTTNLSLADLLRDSALFARMLNGSPLPPDQGGPMRLVVPHLYGWKSAKWIESLELVIKNKPGFWEELGYHDRGDPWKEERFR